MSVNGISNVTQTYDSASTTKAQSSTSQKTEETKQNNAENTVAVYDKSEQTVDKKKIYTKDTVSIDKLMAEVEKRSQALRDLVEKMMLKQGQTFTDSTDIYAKLREGSLQVDPETQAQAKKDIAEDGYWGVNQTSDRMLSFAKALTGGDTSKADEMIEAVKKGYEAAEKAWGDDLPEISKKTMEATISKLEAWRDGTDTNTTLKNAAAMTFKNQAATGIFTE